MKKLAIISAVICTVFAVSTYVVANNNVNDIKERNDFKKELLNHYDSLCNMQRNMIDELANHLWKEHDCDIPQFDGDALELIHEQENIIDSLYNTQH